MPFQIERVPRTEVPKPRATRRWRELSDALLAATRDGEAIKVAEMSDNQINNFSQHMRKQGWKVTRRRFDEAVYLTAEPMKKAERKPDIAVTA